MADQLARYELRKDTAARWASFNPVLRNGEIGYELDANRYRIGDGVTPFVTLPTFPGLPTGQANKYPRVAANGLGWTFQTATEFLNGLGLTVSPTDIATGLVPAGTVTFFAGPNAPTGFLKANGAAVSRTTYAALWSVIGGTYGLGNGSTTFNVPDMRGLFARALDEGRGFDPGRGLGTFQDQQNAWHQHTGSTSWNGDHQHSNSLTDNALGGANGGWAGTNIIGYVASGVAGGHSHTFTTNAQGGDEARPRNLALLACIKF